MGDVKLRNEEGQAELDFVTGFGSNPLKGSTGAKTAAARPAWRQGWKRRAWIASKDFERLTPFRKENRRKGHRSLEARARAYWQSARALAVHCPKPLATMLRMTEQT